MSTITSQCSYRKTKSGQWVVYGPTSIVRSDATVTVGKRSGETKSEHVASTGKPFQVDGVEMVYGYKAERSHSSTSDCTCGMHRSYRTCRTGGNCSSFGSGRNCGGCDCDGY